MLGEILPKNHAPLAQLDSASVSGTEGWGSKSLVVHQKGETMKNLWKEFKEFIARGNVVDLSVAVIIGAAFAAIVTALTDKIIMPLVNWVLALCGGKDGLESAYTILNPGYTDGVLDLSKSIYIDWGALIASILNFLIIAVVVFAIIKIINNTQKKLKKLEGKVSSYVQTDLVKEKVRVRKLARSQKRPFKVVWKEFLDQKEEERLKAEEEAKKLAEEQAMAEAIAKANNPSQEELLKDIKELLKANLENKKD